MNWRDYAWLFVNGAFQFKCMGSGVVRDTEGIDSDGKIALWIDEEPDPMKDLVWSFPDELVLVARKIEDMTTEEEFENGDESISYGDWRHEGFEGLFPSCVCSFLHLLSIGVYPFDQSHFNGADVVSREGA